MYVSGSAASGAACERTCQLRFGRCGECSRFFVTHVYESDASVATYGICEGIEAVAGYGVDVSYAAFGKHVYDLVGYEVAGGRVFHPCIFIDRSCRYPVTDIESTRLEVRWFFIRR